MHATKEVGNENYLGNSFDGLVQSQSKQKVPKLVREDLIKEMQNVMVTAPEIFKVNVPTIAPHIQNVKDLNIFHDQTMNAFINFTHLILKNNDELIRDLESLSLERQNIIDWENNAPPSFLDFKNFLYDKEIRKQKTRKNAFLEAQEAEASALEAKEMAKRPKDWKVQGSEKLKNVENTYTEVRKEVNELSKIFGRLTQKGISLKNELSDLNIKNLSGFEIKANEFTEELKIAEELFFETLETVKPTLEHAQKRNTSDLHDQFHKDVQNLWDNICTMQVSLKPTSQYINIYKKTIPVLEDLQGRILAIQKSANQEKKDFESKVYKEGVAGYFSSYVLDKTHPAMKTMNEYFKKNKLIYAEFNQEINNLNYIFDNGKFDPLKKEFGTLELDKHTRYFAKDATDNLNKLAEASNSERKDLWGKITKMMCEISQKHYEYHVDINHTSFASVNGYFDLKSSHDQTTVTKKVKDSVSFVVGSAQSDSQSEKSPQYVVPLYVYDVKYPPDVTFTS